MHRACLGLLCGTDRYTLTILVAILGGGGLIVQALLAGGVAPALMQNITRGLVRIPSSCTHECVYPQSQHLASSHTPLLVTIQFSIYVLGMLIGGLWYAWRLNRVLSRRAAVGGAAPLHTALSKVRGQPVQCSAYKARALTHPARLAVEASSDGVARRRCGVGLCLPVGSPRWGAECLELALLPVCAARR